MKSPMYTLGFFTFVLSTIYYSAKGSTMSQQPHYEEEVTYQNREENINLSGTLTLPNSLGAYPAVILIAGYGPNDRDVTGMGHKYFKVLAEYLTSQGMAVLRYDKRGVGQSTGNWSSATSKELAHDVLAGIAYLETRKEINHNQIGLIGLSEGGLIAAMVASQSPNISFVVLMAPYVALNIDDMTYHTGLQLFADGASTEFVEQDKAIRKAIYTISQQEDDTYIAAPKIRKALLDYLEGLSESKKVEAEKLPWAFTEGNIDMMVTVITSPAYRFFLTYDPIPMLETIKIPLLVIAGNHDLTTAPSKIFPILERAFKTSKHKDYTIIELPNLNHLFQTCKTGALAEYATITETIAPIALHTISDWILTRTGRQCSKLTTSPKLE